MVLLLHLIALAVVDVFLLPQLLLFTNFSDRRGHSLCQSARKILCWWFVPFVWRTFIKSSQMFSAPDSLIQSISR